MADTPTSPLVKLRQRLLPGGLAKSETVRVVAVKAKDEKAGSTPVKTKGCLSDILSRYRRPLTASRLAGRGSEVRFRVPATLSLPSANLVVGGTRGTYYRSAVSRGNDTRPHRNYYNRRSRSD